MLPLGDLLIAAKLADRKQVDAALARQELRPARLVDILVEMGAAERGAIDAFMERLPPEPANLADTGISDITLIDLLIKLVYAGRLQSVGQMTDAIKLPRPLVSELVNQCVQRHLLQAAGSGGQIGLVDMNYYLTDTGQAFAKESLQRSKYAGPAPVSLDALTRRVRRQKITSDPVTWERIRGGLGSLTIADTMVEKLGPALNSGRAILLYGPPG